MLKQLELRTKNEAIEMTGLEADESEKLKLDIYTVSVTVGLLEELDKGH
jgi:hypothetical protein